jgi:hypothetical protein
MFFKFFKCFAGLEVKLIFHMTKEGFCRSVVDAVSFSWHGLDTTHFSYLLSEAWMCIMESLIRVDICSLEIPLESRIIRCFVLELIKSVLYWRETKVWWEFVSESFSADHIFEKWEICPSIIQAEIGDICSELLVWETWCKVTTQKIWCCIMLLCGFLYLFVRILSSDLGKEIILLHETKYFFVVHLKIIAS